VRLYLEKEIQKSKLQYTTDRNVSRSIKMSWYT